MNANHAEIRVTNGKNENVGSTASITKTGRRDTKRGTPLEKWDCSLATHRPSVEHAVSGKHSEARDPGFPRPRLPFPRKLRGVLRISAPDGFPCGSRQHTVLGDSETNSSSASWPPPRVIAPGV